MMKNFFTYLLLIASLSSFGQLVNSDFYPSVSEKRLYINLRADQIATSNSLTNGFLFSANQSDYIDNVSKLQQINTLKEDNKFGQTRHIALESIFKNNNGAGNSYYVLGLRHQYFSEASFGKDIASLVLLGNLSFLGSTISVPELSYSSIYFNQINLGMIHVFKTPQSLQNLHWGINLNFGQNFNITEVKNSSFYTSLDGDEIDIALELEMLRSDTSWHNPFNFAGFGASLDLAYDILINDKIYLSAKACNLGIISWTDNPIESRIDTSLNFTGVSLDTTSQEFITSLLNLSLNEENEFVSVNYKETHNSILPMEFELNGGMFFNEKKLYSGLRFHYNPMIFDIPLTEVFTSYKINNKFIIIPVVALGGFGGFHAGTRFQWTINDHFEIFGGSSYLSSLINFNNGKGSGGAIKLRYTL